jgi:CubicO group peptidase (beta-lactamase class C family)
MTRLQFRVLYRQFLFRMVDLELLAPEGDINQLLGQFAALLMFLSVLAAIVGLRFAEAVIKPHLLLGLTLTYEHFLIATTMLVVGLFAVLAWDSTFPNQRDVLVLAPLPVRGRTLFLAKVAAAATALCLTVLSLHSAAGLAWPFAFAVKASPHVVSTLTFDPAIAPVGAADLQTVLNDDLARGQTPGSAAFAPGTGRGAAIGVFSRGVRRVFAYGTAKPDSVFEIGSITKTITGLVLAQMVMQGKAKYDEPVRELLPAGTVARPAGREITLVDLATQHSGLNRMPGNIRPTRQPDAYPDYREAELYAYMARRGVAKTEDTPYFYSNLGFGLLGHALSNRAGTTYADLVRQQVTGPLGLRDTVVTLSPEQQARWIQGYDVQHQPVPPPRRERDALAASGAIQSTAVDMLAYLEAQLHPERLVFAAPDSPIATAATLPAAVRQSQALRADAEPGLRAALGWVHDPASGSYTHGGSAYGYTGLAVFNPKDDYAAILLVNSGPSGVTGLLGQHIVERLAGQPAISLASTAVPASGGILALLQWFMAYWITMMAAGAFTFCCVLGLQGLAAQLLPRRLFLRVSSLLQLAAFSLFISVYFLQPAPQSLILEGKDLWWLKWLPSYWFLGLFQQLTGSPALAVLARRAWMGLAIAVCGTAVAYLLSYLRTLRQIVEEPDIVSRARVASWLPPFGNALSTAIGQFSVRSLLRSRQHRVILAFYLGLGFAVLILFLKTPIVQQLSGGFANNAWHAVSVGPLIASIVTMCCSVLGTRVVFSMPLDLRANWIFRITPIRGGTVCVAPRRRALVALSVVPVWAACAVLFLSMWPWRPAIGHLAVLGLLGMILAELCLHGIQKIPFTCSYLPGKSNVYRMFWLCLGLLLALIAKGVQLEQQALQDVTMYVSLLSVLGAVWLWARWRTTSLANTETADLHFEEEPSGQMVTLELSWTGGLPTPTQSPR